MSRVIFLPKTTTCNMYRDKVLMASSVTGKFVIVTNQIYELLLSGEKNGLDEATFTAQFEDVEDRTFISELITRLYDYGIIGLISHRHTVSDVTLLLTERCNLSCKHCCADASHVGDCSNNDPSLDTLKDRVDKILSLQPDTVVLSGGEPMLHKNFHEIVRYVRSHFGGHLGIMTNGTLINETNVQWLCRHIDAFDLSIDGVNEATCAKIRGKGVFNKVINAVQLLKQAGAENVSLSMVLTPENQSYAEEFIALNEKLGTKPVPRKFLVGKRAKENAEIWGLPTDSDAVDRIRYEWDRTQSEYEGLQACSCGGLFSQISISHNGDIHPCNLLSEPEFSLGNVDHTSNLQKLLFEPQEGQVGIMKFISILPENHEACWNCSFNVLCWHCPADLHSMYTESRELFDMRCAYRKQYYERVIEGGQAS